MLENATQTTELFVVASHDDNMAIAAGDHLRWHDRWSCRPEARGIFAGDEIVHRLMRHRRNLGIELLSLYSFLPLLRKPALIVLLLVRRMLIKNLHCVEKH